MSHSLSGTSISSYEDLPNLPGIKHDPYSMNPKIYQKYKNNLYDENIIIGGRLGRFMYYNMDQIIAMALAHFKI